MPPLIFVPAAALVNDRTWQVAHPILSKSQSFLGQGSLRELLVARRSFCRAHEAGESDRYRRTRPDQAGYWLGAVLQSFVTSSGKSRFVIPISLI